MNRVLLLTIFTIVASCGGPRSDNLGERFINREQGYSLTRPNGWTNTLVRGHLQLSPKDSAPRSKQTIVIRSFGRQRTTRSNTTTDSQETIVSTTARVLGALPQARLSGEQRLQGTDLPATRFSLVFVPPGLRKQYRREHVVLIGEKHIFHVIYTSPSDEPIDEASLMNVVSTLNEEG